MLVIPVSLARFYPGGTGIGGDAQTASSLRANAVHMLLHEEEYGPQYIVRLCRIHVLKEYMISCHM